MHCLERGHLMGKIWWSEMELFQRLLQLREADAQIVQREREAYQAEADMLRQQVEEMQAAATPRPSPTPTHLMPEALGHCRCSRPMRRHRCRPSSMRMGYCSTCGGQGELAASCMVGCFSAVRSHLRVLEKASRHPSRSS